MFVRRYIFDSRLQSVSLLVSSLFRKKSVCINGARNFSFNIGWKATKFIRSSKGLSLVAAAVAIGVGSEIYNSTSYSAPIRKNRVSFFEHDLSSIPEVKPSRTVTGPTKVNLKLTLFQYQTCPFCCKVRSFLEYYGIPFDLVEVNPVMRQQIEFSNYRKVPILIARDEDSKKCKQLNDSSLIISILSSYLQRPEQGIDKIMSDYQPITYSDAKGNEIVEVSNKYVVVLEKVPKEKSLEDLKKERDWRKWVDNDFVHVLSPNIYRSWAESFQAFNYFSEVGEWDKNFNRLERFIVINVGAAAMYFVGKKLKRKYELKNNVRISLYDACNRWLKAVGKAKFLGGDKPNLADLATYGALNSIEGCIAFNDLLDNTKIKHWYYAMKESVHNQEGTKELADLN